MFIWDEMGDGDKFFENSDVFRKLHLSSSYLFQSPAIVVTLQLQDCDLQRAPWTRLYLTYLTAVHGLVNQLIHL